MNNNESLTNGTVVEVGALIDDSPWGRYAKLVVALGCVALLVEGLENQVISMSIPALMQDWGLERSDFAIVTGAGLLAIAIGTAFGGLLADRYGRRPALLGSVLLFGVMTMLSAASTGPATLSVFRFLAGLGIGGAIPGCLALVSEFTPQRNRSMAIALCLACAPLGALLCSLLTGGILTWFDWRMLYVVQGIIPMLLVLLLFFTLPESPKYLARDPHREGELRTLLRKLGCAVSERTGFCREEAKQRAVSFRDLLSRDIRAETLRLWSAFLFFQMAGYTLIGLIAAGIVISLLSVLLIHNHVPGKRAFTQLNEA